MLRVANHSALILALAFAGCEEPASSQDKHKPLYETDKFKSYWYAGKAELNSYKLDEARYGENHPGEAVLIFVTEPFSRSKQVKLDDPGQAGEDNITVLKLNFTKHFVTGIYPYSMMLSVFSPLIRRSPLKITMSAQEWCGHVYAQMNLRENQNEYKVESRSYFEMDGDLDFTLSRALLEDEIWNLIRTDPGQLPTGSLRMIPGLFFTRLHHSRLREEIVNASLRKDASGNSEYVLAFTETRRTLSIRFDKKFPHKILGWVEEFNSPDGKRMKTSATLDRTLVTDYWTKNKKQFKYLRDSLDLPY